VLPKLCGLDFSGSGFPDLHVAQTGLAKVHTLIVRRDHLGRQAYLIIVGRSVTEYVWGQLLDAAEEFEPVVVNGSPLIRPLIEGDEHG
jgi:sarcosine oxidase gamma subunit